MAAMEISVIITTVTITTATKGENFPSKTRILYIRPSTDKIEIARLVLDEKKCCNPKEVHFRKTCPKFDKVFAFHGYPLQF